MKPLERRLAALEAAHAPEAVPIVIRRVLVDRMPDGTLVETPHSIRSVNGVRMLLPDEPPD